MTIIRNTVPLPEPPAVSVHGHIPGLEFPRSEADETRASIVAFLNAERQKFERALAEHIGNATHDHEKSARLDASAATIRMLIASIECGGDMGPWYACNCDGVS